MALSVPSFVHEFAPATIRYGSGCIAQLNDTLEEMGAERVLIVCGSNVSANRCLMEPIEGALGPKLIDVFTKTSPAKKIETTYEGVNRVQAEGIDAVVSVGGGSSHDVATAIRSLHADYRPLDELVRTVEERDSIDISNNPNESLSHVSISTTLSGAELSESAGIMVPTTNGRRGVVISSSWLVPDVLFFDPNLYETTPTNVLVGSAMNGFDKGIEGIYSQPNPISDAVSIRGLEYFRSGLPGLRNGDDPMALERTIVGSLLVQLRGRRASIVHAYGHGLRRHFGVQQGLAHAVLVPHVLELLFDRVDARREVLASALVKDDDQNDMAVAVVEAVTEIRDSLGLPSRLKELEGVSPDGFRRVAELTHNDPLMKFRPSGFDPSVNDLERVLVDAW